MLKSLLIANGVSLEDISKLTPSEAYDLWITLQCGLWGFKKDYLINYNTQCILHDIGQILIAVNSKKHKNKSFTNFDKLYPNVDLFMNCGRTKKPTDINDKFRKLMLDMGCKA